MRRELHSPNPQIQTAGRLIARQKNKGGHLTTAPTLASGVPEVPTSISLLSTNVLGSSKSLALSESTVEHRASKFVQKGKQCTSKKT